MKMNRLSLLSPLFLSAILSPSLLAQTFNPTYLAELATPDALTESSSSSVPAIPSGTLTTAQAAVASTPVVVSDSIRPFSSVGVDAKIGLGGIGFDVATPIARKFNLRGGGNFFGYTTTISENNIDYSGDIKLRTGQLSL